MHSSASVRTTLDVRRGIETTLPPSTSQLVGLFGDGWQVLARLWHWNHRDIEDYWDAHANGNSAQGALTLPSELTSQSKKEVSAAATRTVGCGYTVR